MGTLQRRWDEFDTTFDRRVCHVAGVEMVYRSGRGTGQAVVFLPGGAGEATSWFDQALRLGPAYRPLLVDIPAVPGVDSLVDGVVGVLDQEDLEVANLVGTSLGGMLASGVARAHPDRIRSLTMGNTGFYGRSKSLDLRIGLWMSRVLPSNLLRKGAEKRIAGLLDGVPDSDFWTERATAAFRSTDVSRRLICQQRILLEFVDRLAELTAPHPWRGAALVIRAADDTLMNPASTQRLIDAHVGCKVHEFSSGGHRLPQSRPDEYAALLVGLLNEANVI